MEYHALIGVHHESIAPPMTAHLPSYNTESEVTAGQPHNVGKKASSSFSDHLSARYPYPEDVHYDYQEPSIAYGTVTVATVTVDGLGFGPPIPSVTDDGWGVWATHTFRYG
jgi:hypothetical protein